MVCEVEVLSKAMLKLFGETYIESYADQKFRCRVFGISHHSEDWCSSTWLEAFYGECTGRMGRFLCRMSNQYKKRILAAEMSCCLNIACFSLLRLHLLGGDVILQS